MCTILHVFFAYTDASPLRQQSVAISLLSICALPLLGDTSADENGKGVK